MAGIPAAGSTFAGYRLDEVIGSGNMGTVFKAWNPVLHRHEALKVLSVPEEADVADRMRELFRDEIRIAANLRAPNIISVFDGGDVEGLPWYTMTYAEGDSLGEELASFPPKIYEVHEVIAIVHDVAEALDALANMSPPVVHGDVKPSNIMAERSHGAFSSAMLVDFGVATTAEVGSVGAGGRVAGSLPYMAPEILRSGKVSAAGDQYALACTAHELLAGAKAFPAADVAEARQRHGGKPPSTGYGVNVDRVMHRAMAADPGKRWSTCSEFANNLGAALVGAETGRRRNRRLAAIAIVLAGVTGAGAIVWPRPSFDPKAVLLAEGSSLEYAPLPIWESEDADGVFTDGRWLPMRESDSRFSDMAAAEEFAGAYRLPDQSLLPRFRDDAELFVFVPAAGEAGHVTKDDERENRTRLLAPLDPLVAVELDVVKLLVPSIGMRVQVLQTSGTTGSGSGEEFCMIRPWTPDERSNAGRTPWFVVMSPEDACVLVYDAMGELVASGE